MLISIINGKKIARHLNYVTAIRVRHLRCQHVIPTLLEILVGNDPANRMYLRVKHRQAHHLGIKSVVRVLPKFVQQGTLLHLLRRADQDYRIDGIVVQSPLPRKLNLIQIDRVVAPEKDADGMNPINVGRLADGYQGRYPVRCTPRGVMTILKACHVPLAGKRVVVIGRSRIVGKPMASMLINAGALVTVLNHLADPLANYTRTADVIISATGRAHLVKAYDVKLGVTVIDVGEDAGSDGCLTGDVDLKDVARKAKLITPVPGGVGPVTVAILMRQVVELTEWRLSR